MSRITTGHLVPHGAVSNNPDDFGPSFDVLLEVKAYPRKYTGESVVSLYHCPRYAKLNVRRVQAHSTRWTPDMGAVIGASVLHGVHRLHASDVGKEFLSLFRRVELDDDPDPDDAVELDRWRHSFRFDVRDAAHSGPMRLNFRTTDRVRGELFGLADKLGLSGSRLGIVCLMAGLCQQPGVIPKHAEYMEEVVAEFDDALARRVGRLRRQIGA